MQRSISTCILVATLLTALTHTTFAEDEPTPHAVIDRALKAGGGAEKVKQFKAVYFKADWTTTVKSDRQSSLKFDFSGLIAGPNLFRIEVLSKDQGFSFEVVADGKPKGIGKLPEMQAIVQCMTLPDRLLELKGKEYRLTLAPGKDVKGVATVAVRALRDSVPETVVYFAKDSGLPVKAEVTFSDDDDNGTKETVTVATYFSDYKEIAGVLHFTKLIMQVGSMRAEVEFRELQLLKTYDAGAFKKPG